MALKDESASNTRASNTPSKAEKKQADQIRRGLQRETAAQDTRRYSSMLCFHLT